MKCGCCGKELGEFTFDKAYQMPDEIWNLNEDERSERAKIKPDLCRLDNRYFLRGVAYLPVMGTDKDFGWGIWAEISEEKFFEYVKNYSEDNSGVQPYLGKVANSLPYYPETLGIVLHVQLGDETQRPAFIISEPGHLLTKEQLSGIALERVHEFNGKQRS